jgi:arylsulfatase A-like enzyme
MKPAVAVVVGRVSAAIVLFSIGCYPTLIGKQRSVPVSSEGWHGLSGVYRNGMVARSGESFRREYAVPAKGWLDLALGTLEEEPITFRVTVVGESSRTTPQQRILLFEQTVLQPDEWQSHALDLSTYAGRKMTLEFALSGEKRNATGLWGTLRVRGARPASPEVTLHPRGVILILADTLRADHLELHGYQRVTAPTLTRLAREGAWFRNAIAQATWTQPSVASLLTSLYPSSHGVCDFDSKIPDDVQTIAESYQNAGHSTVGFSSVNFTGRHSNAHRGFDELHESVSLPDDGSSKTAREYVDRLVAWLEKNRDVPFFVFLHLLDPHSPYRPHSPYDRLWVDRESGRKHLLRIKTVREQIHDSLMHRFAMPSRREVMRAGLDPAEYIECEKGWYDGSIRGMDEEIARVLKKLDELGIGFDTLVVFTSDHGEEFFDHGRTFHGQSVYSELTGVPLIMNWPAGIDAGVEIVQTVQLIDLMPTMLELSGIPVPNQVQGRSLASIFTDRRPLEPMPAFSEKPRTQTRYSPEPRGVESVAVYRDRWKLIRTADAEVVRFELFDRLSDRADMENVASEHPEIVGELDQLITEWKSAVDSNSHRKESDPRFRVTKEMAERIRALGYAE